MRSLLPVLVLLAACGQPAAHEFPAEARAKFADSCPTGKPECDCLWDKVTRTMSPEEFDAAMERFRVDGLMDPKLTSARLECREAK